MRIPQDGRLAVPAGEAGGRALEEPRFKGNGELKSTRVRLATELDDLDREILKSLQDDSRVGFAALARELEASETTVRYRVKRLEKKGVIEKYVAIVNPKKVGWPIAAIISVKVHAGQASGVFKQLVSVEEMMHVLQSTGDSDFVLIVHARDMEHLNEVARRTREMPGVKAASVAVATGLMRIETGLKV